MKGCKLNMATNFTYVKKGYNPIEVDNYIETLENVIKSYKEKDASIKNAIINAQIAADNIVGEAQKSADDLSLQAMNKVEAIRSSIEKQRSLVKAFQDEYNTVVQKYVHDFNAKDIIPVYGSINELEDYLASLTIARGKLEKSLEENKPRAYNITDPSDHSSKSGGAGGSGGPGGSSSSSSPEPKPAIEKRASAPSGNSAREDLAELLK